MAWAEDHYTSLSQLLWIQQGGGMVLHFTMLSLSPPYGLLILVAYHTDL